MLKEFLTNLTNPNCTFHSYFLSCSFSYFCFSIIQNLKSYLLDNLPSLTHTKAAFAEQNEFNYFYVFCGVSVGCFWKCTTVLSHVLSDLLLDTISFLLYLTCPRLLQSNDLNFGTSQPEVLLSVFHTTV